jgi:pimeloyl-ACP methyl ester carboxylesterase
MALAQIPAIRDTLFDRIPDDVRRNAIRFLCSHVHGIQCFALQSFSPAPLRQSKGDGPRWFDSQAPRCNHPVHREGVRMAGVDWTDSTVMAAGIKLHLSRAGRGRPVVVLHHETGTLDRLPFYDALAQKYDVLVPHHPGYSRSQRPDWMRSMRDIAVIYRGLLSDLKVEKAALVGLGFGGWIAAEMASMAPGDLSHLVLVGAMGVKPPAGDILDLAVTGYIDYARAGFHDQKAFDRVYGAEPSGDQLEMWDICREMSFRIAWKPYMYSQTLPHLLGAVRAPALLVWGDDDKVVPQSAAKRYLEALPKARLEIVRGSGHCVDMEQPEALAGLVTNFIGRE